MHFSRLITIAALVIPLGVLAAPVGETPTDADVGAFALALKGQENQVASQQSDGFAVTRDFVWEKRQAGSDNILGAILNLLAGYVNPVVNTALGTPTKRQAGSDNILGAILNLLAGYVNPVVNTSLGAPAARKRQAGSDNILGAILNLLAGYVNPVINTTLGAPANGKRQAESSANILGAILNLLAGYANPVINTALGAPAQANPGPVNPAAAP